VITKPRLIKLLIAGLCAVFFPVIQAPIAQANTCSSYSVGYQGPLTGPEAAFGTSQLNAVKFAMTKFRAANSSSMLSSTIITADDQGDPALSQNAANSLINNPCVIAVVGPAYSGASRVALPLYLAAGMPMITPSATNETIAQFGGSIFHRSARTQRDVNLDIMRDVAAATPDATIAYFYDENYYAPNWITSGFAGITVTSSSLSSGLRAENAIAIKKAFDAGARYFLYDGQIDKQNIRDFAQDVKTLSSSNRVIFSSNFDPVEIKDLYTTSMNGSWFYPSSLSFSLLNSTLGTEFYAAYPSPYRVNEAEVFDAAYFFFKAITAGADTRAKVNTYISTKKMAGLGGNLEFKADGDRDFYRTPQVVLSGGNLSITNSSTLGLNGNYQVADRVSVTNYKLKILDWDDSSITTYRHVVYPNHIQTFASDAVSDIYLPDGETTIEVLPNSDVQDPLKRRFVLKVTMAAGQYTGMTYSTTSDQPVRYSRSGDLRTFSLGGFNFNGTISDTGDFSGAVAVFSSVSGSTITGMYKIPITSGNKIRANLDTTKTYQVEIYPSQSNYQFNWKTTWSNVSFAGASTLTYSGALQASNIFGKVTSLPTSGGVIRVLKKDSSNNWVTDFSRSIASTRDFGFYLAPGTEYKLQAVPNGNGVGPVTTDLLVAPTSGTATLSDLTFSTPNVSGTLAFGSTKFSGTTVYAYRSDDDSEAFNGVTDSNGVYRAFLTPGIYNFYADQPSYLHRTGSIKCVVVSTTTPLVCDVPVVKKNVTGRVTVGGVGFRTYVSAHKFQDNNDGNYGQYGADNSTDDGSFALDLRQSGTYQFSARRVITSSNGEESYVPLGFADKCTVSSAPSTCNVTLTPNFKVSMVDSSGNPLSPSASISFFVPIIESGVVQEKFDEVSSTAENNIGTDGLSIPNGTHFFVVSATGNPGYRTDFSTRNFYKIIVENGQVSSLTTLAGEAVLPVNGSYVVKAKTPNLKIRALNGQSPHNNALIQIISRDGLGNSYYWSGNNNNLEFKLPTGVFELQLRPNGSEDPPMGVGKYVVTVDSQGVATVVNSSGTPVSATVGIFDVTLGIPNLTGTLTLSGNGTNGYINWMRKTDNKYWAEIDGSEALSSGKFGGTFEPGIYKGAVYIYSNYQQKVFVTQECIVPVSGSVVCDIATPTNSLKFRIKDSSGKVVNTAYAQLNFISADSPNFAFGIGYPNKVTGYFETPVTNGTYELEIRDNSGASYKKFTFTVTNGTISNLYDTFAKQSISITSDAYELEFQAPNVKGTLQDSFGSPLAMAGKGVDLSIQKYVNSNWNWHKNIWLNDPEFTIRIDEPGTYRLAVNPYDFDNYSLTYSANFYVNSALDASASSSSGFTAQLSNFNVLLKSNNFNYKVLNPIDDKPIAFSRVAIYKKDNSAGESYYSDRYVYGRSDAVGGNYLAAGSYRIVVDPINQANLDQREYLVSVDSNEAVTVTYAGTPLSKVNDRYVLSLNKANVFGRLYDSVNNVVNNSTGWINIQLQKKSTDGTWNFMGKSTQVSQDGYFGMRVTEVGTFRLAVQPYQRSDIGLTFSNPFDITSENLTTFSKEFSALVLNAPNVKISVGVSAISSPLMDAQINVTRLADKTKGDYLWWDGYSSTPENGVAGFYLPYAGDYQIVVRPNMAAATAGATAKTYRATATEGSDGKVSVAVAAVDGVSIANGVTRLVLGVANIKGTVTRPDTATAVTDTYVVPIKVENGNQFELWEKSTNTDSNGNFAITLGEGTYKIYARAPWNSLIYGDSKVIGEIVVDSSGAVTSVPVGKQALNFIIPLSVPTWSGVVKNPAGTEVVEGAWLCLNYRATANSYRGDCKNTDSQGRFAFTLPDGASLDSNSSLDLNAPSNLFPNLRLNGQTAIESFLGSPGSGKVLLFPSANVKINVTADGVGVPDTRVEVLQNGEWIGNQATNSSGRAEFYSRDITSAMMAQAWVGNSSSALNARYVTTKKDFSANEVANGTTNSVFTGNIALATPNIKGVVRLPSVNGVQGAQSRQAYINVYDRDIRSWVSWTNVSEDGTFALFLKGGCCESKNYTLILEPFWDASSTNDLVRKEFDVSVSTTNVATITDRSTGLAIPTESLGTVLVSTFVMGTPNIVGSVVNPSGTKVSNVGVEIYGQEFTYGTYSNQIGDFKESLPNGTYTAQAGMWGNNTGFAPSARCQIEIAQNKVQTPGAGCVNSDGTLRLALRAANFTFTLKNSGTPITNAYVYLNIGGWGTHAYPDSTGKVTFFVDDVAIAAQSQNEKYGTNTFTPHIYVYPYGQTNGAIQWSCSAGDSKPICSQLSTYTIGTPWADKHLGDVQVLTSNIKIKIVRPVGTESIGEYAYAEILRIDRGYDEWAGWGRTDSDGFAGFYIETSTALAGARYKVRVTPPWHLRSAFTAKVWDNNTNGYTYDQLNNLQLALGTPNLKVSVVSPNGSTPNKWGWAYIEEVDSNNRGIKWVDSTGLDEFGKTAYILEASKRYRLVAHPAGGRSGAITSCLIQSDSTTALAFVSSGCVGGTFNSSSEMTLVLARGNIIGTVYSANGTTPVEGAIIYANIVGATDEKMAVTSCTLANGTYGISLDPNYRWNIKVFPINKPGVALQLENKTDLAAITPPAIGESTTLNVTLSAKP
jgi:branched-chain amino acid transport system substrate-binding protein